MGSTRLPGKVLREVKGRPLLAHTVDRLKRCRLVERIIIATSTQSQDRVLLELAKKEGVEGFAGSENDVLDRYYQAAKQFGPEAVVRCTGDCPMIDPVIVDMVVQHHVEKKGDYTCNTVPRSFPRGYDTEVMTFAALEKAAHEARQPYEREHVTPYIFEHPQLFRLEQVVAKPEYFLPDLRLTVDTPEDFEFTREIFEQLYDRNPYFGIDEVLDLLKRNPKLREINAHIQQKSMHADPGK